MAKKNGGPQQAAPPPAEPAKQRPAYEVRYGRIKAVAWQNDSDKGIWFSVQVTRTYKVGEEFKTATTFGRDDLLVVAEAMRTVWHWIARQKTNGGQTNGDSEHHPGSDEPIPF